MRSSTRSGFAADANGGAVIDCEAIRSSLPIPCAEEAAIDEGFEGFRGTPQRRNDAASRVTIQRPNDISPRRNPTRTVACASAANTPTERAAATAAWAARPPMKPPRDTRKKIPSTANENADGFTLIRVRSAVATNAEAIGAAIGRARVSIGSRTERVALRKAMYPPVATRLIAAKLSMSPRKYAPGGFAVVRTIQRFSRS